MYTILQTAHSLWASFTVILLSIVVVYSLLGLNAKRFFTARDRKIALLALIFSHVQLILGLILYFLSPLGFARLGQMSDTTLRLTSLEHPLVGIIAITLITIGWIKHKNKEEIAEKFKPIAIFYGIGLLLILSRIPWSLWF